MKLISRLIPVMQKNPAWQGLATALDKINDEVFEPVITRFKALSDLSLMEGEDIETRLDEIGVNFSIGKNERKNGAFTYSQRLDELKYKGHAYQIKQTLSREFPDMYVRFPKVYAPRPEGLGTIHNFNYGEHFLMESEIDSSGFSRDQLFLTSRALIEVSTFDVHQHYGNSISAQNKFEAEIQRLIVPLVPVHIVFDGVRYIIRIESRVNSSWSFSLSERVDVDTTIPVNAPISVSSEINSIFLNDDVLRYDLPEIYENPNPVTTRFDVMPFDAMPFDAPFPTR